MAQKEPTFDIVSRVDMAEVVNAIDQALREIQTRFDFKGSKADIKLSEHDITIIADDEYKLSAVIDVLQSKCVRRGVSIKSLKFGKIEPASGATVRQVIQVVQGIDQDYAKNIVKLIKETKIKVQPSIQGDQVRVSGKNRDDLQQVIRLLQSADIGIDLQFINFR